MIKSKFRISVLISIALVLGLMSTASPAAAACGAYTVRSAAAKAYQTNARVAVEVRSNCDQNWVRAASNTRQYVVVTYSVNGMGSRRYEGYTSYNSACGPNGPYCATFAFHQQYSGSNSGYITWGTARVWSASVGYTPYV